MTPPTTGSTTPTTISTFDRLLLGSRRMDVATAALLRLMTLLCNHRASLRDMLRSRDGWVDFTIGIRTESGSVERSITFEQGRAASRRGISGHANAVLNFVDDRALLVMLRSTPNEVLTLILDNDLVIDGSWGHVQLFNYLLAQVAGAQHDRKLGRIIRDDRARRKADANPEHERGRDAFAARPATRLRAAAVDPGVLHLSDPYLSDYSLEDFPLLRRFLDDHLAQNPEVCAERPRLLTDWHREHGFETDATGAPWDPVQRQGQAFAHVMRHKTPVIRDGDPLPGTTTTKPVTGSVVFPDAQGLMIWGELDSLDKRMLIPFDISPETSRTLHHDVFPWWIHRNFREWVRAEHGDQLSQQVDERWVAYFVWKSIGISHTVPDFGPILTAGTSGRIALLKEAQQTAVDDEAASTYGTMIECLEGVEAYADHLGAHAASLAAEAADPDRAADLRTMAAICGRVPRHGATTLREALTSLWILWVALHNENADTGLSLGRLDQVLQPFFDADLQAADSDAERDSLVRRAIELTGAFFMRCTDHFPLSPDIGNYLFGGASSTQALTLGGVRRDGTDAVNDMTYVLLKVTEMLSIRDVNVNARFKRGTNSDCYLRRLCEVNFITAGTPSMHSDDAVFASLRPHGYSEEDIRDWAATGCVEPSISGKHMGHTGSILFNLVAALQMTLHDGWHPRMRLQVGPRTGAVDSFETFDGFFEAFAIQLRSLAALAVQRNNQLAAVHAQHRPTPLLSSMMGGTLRSGRDVTRGGAEINSSGTSNIGLADVTDSMMVILKLVFEERRVDFASLVSAIDADFEGHDALAARARCKVPLFGSGDPEAVAMANRVAGLVHDTWTNHRNHRGGRYTSGFWSMSQHVAYGCLTGALPSGRRAGKAFTPGLTPQPLASKSFLDNIRDVAHLDPTNLDNNMAFNVKLVPDAKDSRDTTVSTMEAYTKTYFDCGGMQIQFNVVTAETLRDAMAHPEAYRGLLVRISGYNAYFVTLNREIQLELIERAEFGL